jgi:CRISPR-associated protein Cmr1
MNTITATYRIVTPMFIGDASQQAIDVRPPSVKGALRFWWRALEWKNVLKEAAGDVSKALRDLHQREAKLFGSAADEHTGGQGCFLLQVIKQPKSPDKETIWPQKNTGSAYLGFGLLQSGKQENHNVHLHRQAIMEGDTFTLQLCFKPKTEEKDIDCLRNLLKVWGLLGGLGSRARRGFGSISLVRLEPTKPEDRLGIFSDSTHYQDAVNKLLSGYTTKEYPPYFAFSEHSLCAILTKEGPDAREVHEQAGQKFKNYRKSLKNDDNLPFGLPTNVYTDERFASPLIFHIHPIGNRFVCLVLYVPSQILYCHYHQENLGKFYNKVKEFVEKNKT